MSNPCKSNFIINYNFLSIIFIIFKNLLKIIIYLHFSKHNARIMYALLPMGVYTLLRIIIYQIDKKLTDCTSIFDFVISFNK